MDATMDFQVLDKMMNGTSIGIVVGTLDKPCLLYQNAFTKRVLSGVQQVQDILSLLSESTNKVCLKEYQEVRYLVFLDRHWDTLTGTAWIFPERWLESVWQQISFVEQMTAEYDTILDSSSDEILVTDGTGKILRVNRVAEKLYGVPVSELIGKKSQELEQLGYYSPALWPIVVQRREKVSILQKTITGHLVYVVGNPVFNADGEIARIVFNSRDVTDIDNLRRRVQYSEETIERFRQQLISVEHEHRFEEDEFVFESPRMASILKLALKVASVPSTVLITGESGVGKGVIAHVIHQSSGRLGEFVSVNCGAIPEGLVESELFGYDEGAFTGARRQGKPGLIELAHKGTLFLDEISELPLSVQVKLLQVIQEREVRHVGGHRKIPVDIRIVAATNQDLANLVSQGQFRKDLYYRINVIPVDLPPLRERREDLPYLMDAFLEKFSKRYGLYKRLSLSAENALLNYSWPGNVRELENILERLLVTTDRQEIQLSDLPEELRQHVGDPGIDVKRIMPLRQAQEEVERQLIQKAYQQSGSSYAVAEMLGINQSTAHRKIRKYAVEGGNRP